MPQTIRGLDFKFRISVRPPGRLELVVFFLSVIVLGDLVSATAGLPQPTDRTLLTLKKIFDEVKEMGPYPGQPFILHEFFAGAPDDDDTNKDQHVVVLIRQLAGGEAMDIQVTYLERDPKDRTIKYAREVKSISCQVAAGALSVRSSDCSVREMAKLAPDILQAVVNKKKLLKLR